MKILFPLIVISFLAIKLLGQDSTFYISGKIYNTVSFQSISYCHITNLNMGIGTVADEKGNFKMICKKNDIIRVTHVGFNEFLYVISKDKDYYKKPILVSLSEEIYAIKEVEVFPYKNYRDFKQKFKEMEIKEYADDQVRKAIFDHPEMTPEYLSAIHKAANPWMTIPYKSPEEKQEEAVQKYIEDDQILHINWLRTKKITNLDSLELNLFIAYCNFDIEYLRCASEYEIYTLIKNKFKLYMRKDED